MRPPISEAGSNACVLVIDDQETTRYILRRILRRGGYEVVEADSGTTGLAMAMTLPDVIIADVNLPDMLGYEVCKRLRSNPLTASIPIIQMSAAFVSDESRVQALDGGADAYLTQPIEPTVLLAELQALLRLRRAEASANLAARQWQTTFDALIEGLALVDCAGALIRANRALIDLLSFVSSEIEGQPISRVFESRFDISFDAFLIRAAQETNVELSTGHRWFRVCYRRLSGDPENDSGSVLMLADITDHKKLQETLKLSERLAATGRLAHIIAHEINNPLEAMSNLLYLALGDTAPNSNSHVYLDQAFAELARVSQITKQVLAYHRETTRPVLTAANELIEGVLAIFRAQMLGNSIRLRAEIDCQDAVNVHPGEIRQVFGNIIANALDALEPEGILRVRCKPAIASRTGVRGVRFLFSDSGCGIPAEVYPKIFDAFYTTKESKGSGIGLWISAEVLRKHGGIIRVRSRTSGSYRGTLFAIFLPTTSPESA